MSSFASGPVYGVVGSGKSALCSAVGVRWGLPVLDGDAAGHAALRDDAVKNALHDRFGPKIFFTRGEPVHREIDRARLARQVFGNGQEAAKAALEAIVHPVIRRRLSEEANDWLASGTEAVLLDAAVMLESGWGDLCDKVVFVEAPRDERLRRVAGRGWDEAELDRREASQWPLDRKRSAADAVIDNGGALEDAVAAFDELLIAWGVDPSPQAPIRTARPDLFVSSPVVAFAG